jgi:hypothetical protein
MINPRGNRGNIGAQSNSIHKRVAVVLGRSIAKLSKVVEALAFYASIRKQHAGV